MSRSIVLAGMAVLAGSLLVGEGAARWYLGLGNPPLTVRDSEIEYLFAPSQDVWRFGNRVVYNEWSMRSGPVTGRRTDARELRVLVLGDSVINGGALTDQAAIATTIAQTQLSRPDRPVFVGNVSAGSWGPENLLAYVKRYGWFDADLVVIVLSTHDITDARTFPDDLGTDFPLATPPLALWEGVTRYLPRLWPEKLSPTKVATQVPNPVGAIDRSRSALTQLIGSARENARSVIVLHHLEREEDDVSSSPLATTLREAVEVAGVSFLSMAMPLGAVGRRQVYYRDSIHINEAGQQVYADVLTCLIGKLETSIEMSSCVYQK